MKRLFILCTLMLIVSLSGTLVTSCQTTTPTPAQKPAPVPAPTPPPLPSPTPTPAPTPKSVPEKTVEPAYTPTPPTQFPQQTNELDIVKDVLGIEYIADGYAVESVLPSAFGLPKQLALLPHGDVVITDFSFRRLQILSNGNLSTLVGQGEVQANAVAVMPDGRVCYTTDKEIARRLANLPSFSSRVKSGYLKRYSELVTSASTGAVFKD